MRALKILDFVGPVYKVLHQEPMKHLKELQVGLDEDLEEKLQWLVPNYSTYHVLKKSLDARRRREAPHFIYSVDVYEAGETPCPQEFPVDPVHWTKPPVLIVGSGPAGLFAALRLCERRIPSILFEQGSPTKERIQAIARFWRYGEMNSRSNVGFGEGGAGLYSDGKLITRIKSPYIPYVMDRLIHFGAPEEIRYLANPHVGSDRIRRIIPVLRQYLLENGCQIHFNTKVTTLLNEGSQVIGVSTEDGRQFHSGHVILACGHSANDVFSHLSELGVHMEGKSFAVGLRIEHPQAAINRMQYREYAEHPKLDAANYKLAHTDPQTGVGVYSFCMCPGGYVLSSGTSKDGVVSNGMSNYNRGSDFANAAIVVSVDYKKHFGENILAGLNWRSELELRAYDMVIQNGGAGKELPGQTLNDFLAGRLGPLHKGSSPSGATQARLDEILPSQLKTELIQGLNKFNHWMKGFISEEAQLYGVESRTSCPLRITRHQDTLESISHSGLYPCGEGAGYAGGITSAACDGIKVADRIAGFD